MFVLYKNKMPLLHGYIEDLENFVEELKKLNSSQVDRREFKIISKNGFDEVVREWHRK